MLLSLHNARHPESGSLPRSDDGAWLTQEGDELLVIVESAEPAELRLAGAPQRNDGIHRIGHHLRSSFRLPIETWAGRARLRVSAGTEVEHLVIDVRPHPNKLGIEAFRAMLDELTAASKDLPWGLSPGAAEAAHAASSPAIVHPAILETELPALLTALERLDREPLAFTERGRAFEPLHRYGKLDATSCRWIFSHPLALLSIRSTAEISPTSGSILFVDQPVQRTSLAHPATRYIRYLIERLIAVLRGSHASFVEVARGRREGHRDPEASAHARDLGDLLHDALLRLERSLRRNPLCHVTSGLPTEAALLALVDHPDYARIQRTTRRLLDPGLMIERDGAVDGCLRRSHELFELLVLLRLCRGLEAVVTDGWSARATGSARRHILEAFAPGIVWQAHGPGGATLELRYQQTFDSFSPRNKQWWTLSGERRPDFVLTLRVDGELHDWLVLDAKYRSSRASVHQGLADLHVYRDALRWEGRAAEGGYVVAPTVSDDASVYASAEYIRSHRMGVLALDRHDWMLPVVEWLGRHGIGSTTDRSHAADIAG